MTERDPSIYTIPFNYAKLFGIEQADRKVAQSIIDAIEHALEHKTAITGDYLHADNSATLVIAVGSRHTRSPKHLQAIYKHALSTCEDPANIETVLHFVWGGINQSRTYIEEMLARFEAFEASFISPGAYDWVNKFGDGGLVDKFDEMVRRCDTPSNVFIGYGRHLGMTSHEYANWLVDEMVPFLNSGQRDSATAIQTMLMMRAYAVGSTTFANIDLQSEIMIDPDRLKLVAQAFKQPNLWSYMVEQVGRGLTLADCSSGEVYDFSLEEAVIGVSMTADANMETAYHVAKGHNLSVNSTSDWWRKVIKLLYSPGINVTPEQRTKDINASLACMVRELSTPSTRDDAEVDEAPAGVYRRLMDFAPDSEVTKLEFAMRSLVKELQAVENFPKEGRHLDAVIGNLADVLYVAHRSARRPRLLDSPEDVISRMFGQQGGFLSGRYGGWDRNDRRGYGRAR